MMTDNGYDEYDALGANGRPLAEDGATPYDVTLEQLRQAVTAQYTPSQLERPSAEVEAWTRVRAQTVVREFNDLALSHDRPTLGLPDEQIVQRLLNEIFGLGEVENLLKLPGVEDVAINGPKDVWIKRQGVWEPTEVTFPNSARLLVLLNRAIAHEGKQAGPLAPIVDARLRGGHRINIVTEPLAEVWPAAVIRLHHESDLTMEDLVARGGGQVAPSKARPLPNYYALATPDGVLTPLAATFLHMAVIAGMNVLVIGATGVGKTTLLGALGKMIPPERRVVVIEDTRELLMRRRENNRPMNCVYFTTRPESVEGLPPIKQDALVRAALRQRPDALTVGEARGAEVFDLLKALWTGHKNGLTSLHAESLAEVPERIRMMLQEAQFTTQVSEEAVALWIAKAFHLGILLRLTDSGRRFVEEIVEFTGGVEGRAPQRNPLFAHLDGRLRLCLGGLQHERALRQAGYTFDLIREAAIQHGEFVAEGFRGAR